MKKIPYTVIVPFSFNGAWYKPPVTIELTKTQALYLKQQGRIVIMNKEKKASATAANRGK